MRRLYQLSLIIMFLLVIFVPPIGTIFADKEHTSASEKRILASFPSFHWSPTSHQRFKKAFSEFKSAFENYFYDHYYLRLEMVTVNSLIKFFLFNSSPHFMAIAGSDRWLFYMGDGEFHDYFRNEDVPKETLSQWHAAISQRRDTIAQWGGKYLLAIAPNKSNVYEEFLPYRIRSKKGSPQLSKINQYLGTTNVAENFLDLSPVLQKGKSQGQLYYQFDTHWTDQGAHIAYLEVIKKLQMWFPQITPVTSERIQPEPLFNQSGDLSLTIGLPMFVRENTEKWPVKSPCAGAEKPFSNNNAPAEFLLTRSGCNKAPPLKILVIGDSFVANLRKYLAETFSEIVFSEHKEFSEIGEFITTYKPDIILHLHVARFMNRAL